jgi:hypothetical protein
MQKIFW